MSIEKKKIGIVKWFDQDKGFGVVVANESVEYFLRRNDISDSHYKYREDKIVVFKPREDAKRNRLQAKDACLFAKVEHWNIFLDHIKTNEFDRYPIETGIVAFPKRAFTAAMQFAHYNSIQVLVQCLKESLITLKDNLELTSFVSFAEHVIFKSYSESDAKSIYPELTDLYLSDLDIDMLFESWQDKTLLEFWEKNHRREIVIAYLNSIESELTEEDKFDLFIHGLYPNASAATIESQIFSLPNNRIKEVIKSKHFSYETAVELFPRIINQIPELGSFIIDQAKTIFSESDFTEFETNLYKNLEASAYLQLWSQDKIQHFDSKFLESALKENQIYHDKLIKLSIGGDFSPEEIKSVLVGNIESTQDPRTWVDFKTLENSIKSLIKLDPSLDSLIPLKNSKALNLLLWAYSNQKEFDFQTLRRKFIFFSPTKQVELIKRLFFLKASGQFDLTIEQLASLTKFDLDLYSETKSQSPEVPIDISTDLLIKLLESIRDKGDFFLETDLISLVLNDLMIDKTHKFKIGHYFERCAGRMEADITESNGSIEKKPYKDKYYFEVHIEREENRWKHVPDKNRAFSRIEKGIKAMDGSKYNPQGDFWGIPGKNHEDVLAMATEYQMEIFGLGDTDDYNSHLATISRGKVPNGITFCEGVLSNSRDRKLNKEFWWCNGLPCLEHCETKHDPEDWEQYTLLDFLRILDIKCDEIDRNGRLIPNGKYYRFMSTVNRFNELLDRLYCKDCDHILHPVELGNFGARNVTRFHCVNEKCENDEVVYLSNCLNGKCKNIVDSRLSQTCPNGLYICDNCGCCCSHSQMNRRLDNLRVNGGSISKSLETTVFKKLGHLERMVFFCYQCGDNMIKEDDRNKKFKCKTCKVQYDLTPYGFKFPHSRLPKEPTDIFQSKGKPLDSNDEDLPF